MSVTPIFKQFQRVRIFGEVSNEVYTISYLNDKSGHVVLMCEDGSFKPSDIKYLVHVVRIDEEVEAEPISDQVEYQEIAFEDILVNDLIEVRQTLGERTMVTRDRVTKIHDDLAIIGTSSLSILGNKFPVGTGLEGLAQTVVLIERPKVLPTEVGTVVSLERPIDLPENGSYVTTAMLMPATSTRPYAYWVITSSSGTSSTRTPLFFKNKNWTVIREGW